MKQGTSTPQIQDWPVNNLKEREDGQSKSKYQSIASEVSKVGVAAHPTPAEQLVLPTQVNRDNAHTNVHLHLLTKVKVPTIQKATKEETTLQLPMQQILIGWPEEGSRKLPEILKSFWQFREHIAIKHTCITWEGRFFIPIALRQTCLKALHNGNPGVNNVIKK